MFDRNELYVQHERLIYAVCSRYARTRGGDVDEYVSEANLVFITCCDTYDAANGATFATYLCTCIRRKLRDLRNFNKRRSAVRSASIDVADENGHTLAGTIVDTYSEFNAAELAAKLTADAQYVAALVLDMPHSVVAASEEKGGRVSNLRSSIRDHLRAAGWCGQRIRDAFNEVSAAL
jgi:RNA polymerase sigma factor (sigma-70 family)